MVYLIKQIEERGNFLLFAVGLKLKHFVSFPVFFMCFCSFLVVFRAQETLKFYFRNEYFGFRHLFLFHLHIFVLHFNRLSDKLYITDI